MILKDTYQSSMQSDKILVQAAPETVPLSVYMFLVSRHLYKSIRYIQKNTTQPNMISRLVRNVSAPVFIMLFYIENTLCKPLEKEVLSVVLDSQSNANLQQSKQFIGTSVIGGLMWPVLLTLTFTAIMRRVPDALQRLLTGTGSNYRYTNHQRISSRDTEYLDNIMRTLLSATESVENMKLAVPLHRR